MNVTRHNGPARTLPIPADHVLVEVRDRRNRQVVAPADYEVVGDQVHRLPAGAFWGAGDRRWQVTTGPGAARVDATTRDQPAAAPLTDAVATRDQPPPGGATETDALDTRDLFGA